MNRDEFIAKFPHASASTIRANFPDVTSNHREASATLVERRQPDEPLAPDQAETRDSARYVVSVTSYRQRLLDEDNLCEKFHVDCLRYAGLLPSDAPGRCRIITTQEKVRSKAEERTEILIESLPIP